MEQITIAVTGGIATGKSTWTKLAAAAAGVPSISCDDVVHEIYEQFEVLHQIGERYGSGVFDGGNLNRSALAEVVFAKEDERAWLEALLHPRVLDAVSEWRGTIKSRTAFVEVPLLYEVDFPLKRDIDVVVACTPETQLSRFRQRNQLDPEEANARIAAQLPIAEKIRRAEIVVWNEGSESVLARQAQMAASWIRSLTS
ncbi:MAG: dephospho-CoA kinase [Verrucomicrobiales bacterium]|jgi:dephospho-CoA kinase